MEGRLHREPNPLSMRMHVGAGKVGIAKLSGTALILSASQVYIILETLFRVVEKMHTLFHLRRGPMRRKLQAIEFHF